MNIDFRDCLTRYEKHGILFDYPDIWEISEQTAGDDIAVTISCSETCFWMLRLLPECPPPPQVVESCVAAFRDEYEDIEVETIETLLAEMPAVSRDLSFFCLELMNHVGLRSVRTSDFSLLVWWQGTHHELQENRPIFDHMTRSVRAEQLLD